MKSTSGLKIVTNLILVNKILVGSVKTSSISGVANFVTSSTYGLQFDLPEGNCASLISHKSNFKKSVAELEYHGIK